jgi:hypothetical protein
MHWKSEDILSILEQCSADFTFPMLDNGYVYLAATRLSLHRSDADWGVVIEVFGYSPRAGLPDTHIYTFASTLFRRDSPEKYRSRQAYDNYLANNPHNESRFIYPIGNEDWEGPERWEYIAEGAKKTASLNHVPAHALRMLQHAQPALHFPILYLFVDRILHPEPPAVACENTPPVRDVYYQLHSCHVIPN